MKYNKILFFIIFSLFAFFACKKEEAVDVNSNIKVYNFSSDKCTVTPDEGFLLSGNSTLAKIDINGSLLWKMNNYNEDYTLPLIDNNFISCTDNYTYITIIKYNTQGNFLNTKNLFMSDSSEVANPKIVELSSGDLFFIGTRVSASDSVLLIIKTDKDLNHIWDKTIKLNSNLSDINKLKEISSNGNVFLIGNTEKIGGQNKISYAMIDSSGTLLWEKENAFGTYENKPTDIQKINSQEYVITGYCDQGGQIDYNYQFFALKVNNLGDSTGLFVTGGSKQDYCISSIFIPGTNNLIMIGMEGRGKNESDLNLSNIKIVTLNSSLSTVVTDKSYAKLESCAGMSAIYNNDGSLSVIGKKNAFENTNIQHTFFLKIKPDGSF